MPFPLPAIAERIAGIIVALALAVGLAGCSAIRLGYNNLPELAFWWLDGYLDFSDEQEPRVRQELARLHAWHREHELPRLAELLVRMEQMAPGPVSRQQACGIVTEFQARLVQVADRSEPAALALADELAPRQFTHLERKYRKTNETFRRDWIEAGAERMRERRYDQLLDRYERIYGRLDEPQRAVLRRGIEQSSFDPARALMERQRRQQDLLQVLRRLADPATPPPEAAGLLRGWVERVQRSPDPAYRAAQETWVQEGCALFSAVHESTTPAQRDQAARRLRAYQRDLRELAGPR